MYKKGRRFKPNTNTKKKLRKAERTSKMEKRQYYHQKERRGYR